MIMYCAEERRYSQMHTSGSTPPDTARRPPPGGSSVHRDRPGPQSLSLHNQSAPGPIALRAARPGAIGGTVTVDRARCSVGGALHPGAWWLGKPCRGLYACFGCLFDPCVVSRLSCDVPAGPHARAIHLAGYFQDTYWEIGIHHTCISNVSCRERFISEQAILPVRSRWEPLRCGGEF